jgi:hypothetical protein
MPELAASIARLALRIWGLQHVLPTVSALFLARILRPSMTP